MGASPLSLAELSTLLAGTFAVQKWIHIGDGHWAPLKTSPSGGARHSIEAYVVARHVDGIDRGTYHYHPEEHALVRLRSGLRRGLIQGFIPKQPGFHTAGAYVVLTSVFERVRWKYDFPRAYRVVLLDAGHLAQTFVLLGSALKLATFQTAAIDDIAIDEHLDIDGVTESTLYVLGAGSRPSGAKWCPNHNPNQPLPQTRSPRWKIK